MRAKLLFIVSHHFYQPTLDALSRLNISCDCTVIPYDDFHHIAAVYGEHADRYDACFTSGVIAKQAIELAYPNPSKPLIPFQISPNALHREILQVILETPATDLTRIAMDFLLVIGSGYSVADFLKIEEIDNVYEANASQTRMIGVAGGHTVEDELLSRIFSLWEADAIDLVICQYSSIIPKLQERGIPYRCSFVSDRHLNTLIQEVLVKLELQQLHDNHPVIIQVFPSQTNPVSENQLRQICLIVQQFIKANLMECVFQDTSSCCVLITTISVLRFLTHNFQSCLLSDYLEQHLDFPFLVAYGVGTTVPHAMNNVQIASKETKITGKPFIVDSKGNLIGPLNSEERMVVSSNSMPDIGEIAKRCNLSAMTIQKIITVLQNIGSDKITTQELANRLHTTLRNANRIMLNLCKGSVARPVYTQTSHSRGRPVQVYALDFGTQTV